MYNKTKRLVISKSNQISIKGNGSSLPIGRIVSDFNNSIYVRILNPENIYQCTMDDKNSKVLKFNTKKELLNAIKSLYKF